MSCTSAAIASLASTVAPSSALSPPTARVPRWGARLRLLTLLCAATAGSSAVAVEVIYQGPPGSSGITGTTPGAAGTAGGAAPAASTTLFSFDSTNLVRMTGGAGGNGGGGANGLPGQPAGAAGAGGAGGLGSASLTTVAPPGPATLRVEGLGGAGGSAGQSGDDVLTSGYAAGGHGGDGYAYGALGAVNGAVQAHATATGGNGGVAWLGAAGNGGNANAILAIALAGAPSASLSSNATAGNGGASFGNPFETPESGISGDGGHATSTLTLLGIAPAGNGWSAVIDGASNAVAGNTGDGYFSRQGGNADASLDITGYGTTSGHAGAVAGSGQEAGGTASASARVRSNYSAVANAVAYGGGAQFNSGSAATAYARATSAYHASAEAVALSGTGRFGWTSPATAEALAEVHRVLGAPQPPASALTPEARAHAIASFEGSTARATSSYRDDNRGASVTASASTTEAAQQYQPEAFSAANVGGAAYGPPVFSNDNPAQVLSFASALPSSASVAALLAGAPTVSAAFAGQQVLGAGTVGAMFFPFTSSAAYQLPFSSGQHLLLGLLNPFESENPFGNFTFSVSNGGVSLYSGTFTTPDQYATFFDDRVLDLGIINANTLDLLVTFTLTEGIYGFNYVVGAGGALAPVPEPSTWLMLALGLMLLAWRAGWLPAVAVRRHAHTV